MIFRQEDIIFLLTGSNGTNLGGYGVSPQPRTHERKLIKYELWVSDSNMFHRDTALIGVSAMGGCVATAGRRSLLSLPRQLVNCNELQVPRSGTYIMKPTASCGAAQLWVHATSPPKYSSPKGD